VARRSPSCPFPAVPFSPIHETFLTPTNPIALTANERTQLFGGRKTISRVASKYRRNNHVTTTSNSIRRRGYRTNVAAYPAWQAWLRENKPPILVVWGKYDPSFAVGGATAYQRDVPSAEVHILDAGHFALDEKVDEIAALIRAFLEKKL
jgi:pimeloyl-ACP methyl ester carboxylesterase